MEKFENEGEDEKQRRREGRGKRFIIDSTSRARRTGCREYVKEGKEEEGKEKGWIEVQEESQEKRDRNDVVEVETKKNTGISEYEYV